MTLQFFRLRFCFEAIDSVAFPRNCAANMVRGAVGYALREVACKCRSNQHRADCAYARLFEPSQTHRTGPSGFQELPRPFVLRTRHLDGQTFFPGQPFHLDVHLFDLVSRSLPYFVEAFALPFLRPARLVSVQQLDEEGRVARVVSNGVECACLSAPISVPLTGGGSETASLSVRFLTPTELKWEGALAPRPEFSVLFARIRDRISNLRALYGAGPLEIDYQAVGHRAARIDMVRCQIATTRNERRSSRTGRAHPLGGFTGEAEYRGRLSEFLPYLRAACWTGVGRQTVWGKGEIALAS